ncbi:MAG: ECF transporter S component [Oliverpabstia sp.]|nr:ECF transporter S component [Oliverpabstia sp.]
MTTQSKTTKLAILGLMTGILLLMAYTPLGYLYIGPLAITFNIIPVAICAITLGPVGGAIGGAVFGLTSFLQCIGVGGVSAMGSVLFSINPFFAVIQCFVPRILDGFLLAYIFRGMRKHSNAYVACAVTGFCSAFLNTLFFMSSLILLYGNTDYLQGMMGGMNVLVFVCTFVGLNAVMEMVSATIVTGAVGAALVKARIVPMQVKAAH